MALLIEKAIESSEQDILDRKKFSENLAMQISSYDGEDCLSIGLMGGWGTGKSSILNMVKSYIDEEKVQIIEFTPWYFSGREQLISDFFQVLAEAVQYRSTTEQVGELAKDLKKYSKILKPLSLIPQLSLVVDVITKGASGLSDFLGEYEENISLDTLKKSISEKLREYPKKIVVFIDEIDRLSKTEINETFQLVRALGDFKNIIYLLAFDEAKICEVADLDKTYLDKIINIPILVPNIQIKKVNRLIFEELNKIISVSNSEKDYWKQIYTNLFENYFENLREGYRFLNVIKFNQEFMMREVNKIDFIIMTFLHHFEYQAYEYIKCNGIHLCCCVGFGDERKPKEYKNTVNKTKEVFLNREFNFQKVISIIFSNKRISNNKQINNTRYFASYFEYSLDEHIFTYDEKMKLLEVIEERDVLDAIAKIGIIDYLENILEICRELDKGQLTMIILCIIKILSTEDKESGLSHSDYQYDCLKKLKSLLFGFDLTDDEYIGRIINGLEISGNMEFSSFVDFCCEIQKRFGKSSHMDKLVIQITQYISDSYNKDVYVCSEKLISLGIDIEQYINGIIRNTDTLFRFLKDISIVVEVGREPEYDENGEIIDVKEYKISYLCIEDIEKYTSQDFLKSVITDLPNEIKEKYKYIISQVMNPRRREDVMEERYGNIPTEY